MYSPSSLPAAAMPASAAIPAGLRRKVVSFDLFDTLLSRLVAPPEELFRQVGERCRQILPPCVEPADFQQRRREAAREAAATLHPEILFDEIYETLRKRTGWPAAVIEELARVELVMEAESLYPIPAGVAYLQKCRENDSEVIYISSMYLPAEFLENLLKRHGIWQDGDRLFVSGPRRCSKYTGDLFHLALAELALPAGDVLHHGNCENDDGHIPVKAGLRIMPQPLGNLLPREEALADLADSTRGFGGLFAGAARYARLHAAPDSEHEATLVEIASGVIAPVMASFALWTLQEAASRGLRGLYFTSRDGYYPLRMANAMAPAVCPGVKLSYLKGSRKAWHVAALIDFHPKKENWLFRPSGTITPRQVLQRLHLDPARLLATLPASLTALPWDQPFTESELQILLAELFASEPFREQLQDRSREERGLALEYFTSIGLLDGPDFGYVDVGWTGRCHRSLDRILREAGGMAPLGLYFGLRGGLNDEAAIRLSQHGFFFDQRYSWTRDGSLHKSLALLESIFSAPHGSVCGYERREGGIGCIEENNNSERLVAWGMPVVDRTLRLFAEALAAAPQLPTAVPIASLTQLCRRTFYSFCQHPTVAEAQAWGSRPFDDSMLIEEPVQLATPVQLTVKNMLMCIRNRGHLPVRRELAWEEGCWQLTPPGSRAMFRRLGQTIRLFNKSKNQLRAACGMIRRRLKRVYSETQAFSRNLIFPCGRKGPS